MANSDNFIQFEHGPVQISESNNNGDDYCYGAEGYFRADAENGAGELFGEDDFYGLGYHNAVPVGEIGRIGHEYGTFNERVLAEKSRNDTATCGEVDFDYEITAFPEAQELQFNTAEGSGTISDDTISTNTSEGNSSTIILPIGHRIPESLSQSESSHTAKSAPSNFVIIGSAGSDNDACGELVRSQISSDVDPSSLRLRPRRGEEAVVETQIFARDPNRFYCQKADHPCLHGRNAGNGFGRDQDRIRHERDSHPTKEQPSDRVECKHCGAKRRRDNQGEHWRKSCKKNPNRKSH